MATTRMLTLPAAMLVTALPMFTAAVRGAQQEPRTTTREVTAGTARVDRIDRSMRAVTLDMTGGVKHTVYVGRELAVFDQLRDGDTVFVRITESVVVALKPGARLTTATDTSAAAQRDASGNTDILQQLKMTATIESVDAAKGLVQYHGADNRSVMRAVLDPHLLDGLKRGDVVEITYTRERAVQLERR